MGDVRSLCRYSDKVFEWQTMYYVCVILILYVINYYLVSSSKVKNKD